MFFQIHFKKKRKAPTPSKWNTQTFPKHTQVHLLIRYEHFTPGRCNLTFGRTIRQSLQASPDTTFLPSQLHYRTSLATLRSQSAGLSQCSLVVQVWIRDTEGRQRCSITAESQVSAHCWETVPDADRRFTARTPRYKQACCKCWQTNTKGERRGLLQILDHRTHDRWWIIPTHLEAPLRAENLRTTSAHDSKHTPGDASLDCHTHFLQASADHLEDRPGVVMDGQPRFHQQRFLFCFQKINAFISHKSVKSVKASIRATQTEVPRASWRGPCLVRGTTSSLRIN